MDSQTSFQQPDTPTHCVNGCGFFGTSSTLNMCSKCYSDHRLKEHQAATAIAAVESLNITSVENPVLGEGTETHKCVEKNVCEVEGSKRGSNRCGCCNKKVGVLGFKCKCGVTFCGSHRYPEEHKCGFDHKSVGQESIRKNNPLVVADKIQRF